jgi:hypothetical protein
MRIKIKIFLQRQFYSMKIIAEVSKPHIKDKIGINHLMKHHSHMINSNRLKDLEPSHRKSLATNSGEKVNRFREAQQQLVGTVTLKPISTKTEQNIWEIQVTTVSIRFQILSLV